MQIIRQQNARKLHFFDYSLWNHYVKDLFVPLLKYRTIVLCLPFSLIPVGPTIIVYFCFLVLCRSSPAHRSVAHLALSPGHNFFDISFYNSFFSFSICVALILVKAKSRLPASFNEAPMR